MTKSLRDNYEKGVIFSYLAPFSYAFYEKFGYHYAFNQKHYRLAAQDFPKGKRSAAKLVEKSLSLMMKMLVNFLSVKIQPFLKY